MGKLISEDRPVANFDRFSFEGMGDIDLVQGQVEALVLEGDEEVLSRIKAEVANGQLVIKYRSWLDLFWPRPRIKVHLTMKEIHEASISGSGSLHAGSLSTDRLRLGVSGAADIEIDHLTADDLDLHVSGAGQIELNGRATRQQISISGSSKVEAWRLESQEARVHVSGSAHITLKVQQTLDVSVSGSGDIRYLGEPRVSQHISGSASVRRLEAG